MTDFFQNGAITTLHDLRTRPLEDMERELVLFARDTPMALVLPSLYSELHGPALPRIVDELGRIDYLDEIIIGLDRADEKQFRHARRFFSRLPQRTSILWHDGPRMRSLDELLRRHELAPMEAGKGRNAWFCFGYVLAKGRAQAVALHDCDITTYRRELPARLLYPVVNPAYDYKYCKGYYARISEDRLSGRVTRLFMTPLLRALRKIFGALDYVEFLDSFRYPLAGEFSMRQDVLRSIRIPADWGLEVGLLSEVYRNLSSRLICQADIADGYDHKHQSVSEDDPDQGLARMSTEIAKSIYRKLATEGITLTSERFRTIKATYYRIALDMLQQHFDNALFNGLRLDRHKEERVIEMFAQNLIVAGENFLASPMERPFIANWNRVFSAIDDFADQLREAVVADNA